MIWIFDADISSAFGLAN